MTNFQIAEAKRFELFKRDLASHGLTADNSVSSHYEHFGLPNQCTVVTFVSEALPVAGNKKFIAELEADGFHINKWMPPRWSKHGHHFMFRASKNYRIFKAEYDGEGC